MDWGMGLYKANTNKAEEYKASEEERKCLATSEDGEF